MSNLPASKKQHTYIEKKNNMVYDLKENLISDINPKFISSQMQFSESKTPRIKPNIFQYV